MIRAWILFSSLVLGVIFRFWGNDSRTVRFVFSERTLDMHSWVYFLMEHVIALGYALCIINPPWLKDSTPVKLLWLLFAILVLDLFHYLLFFRDEGPGWNLVKCIIFGIPLLAYELNRIWKHWRN